VSQPETVLFQLDEEVLSSDLNNIGNLASKAAVDPALGLVGGVDGTPLNVVRSGLLATPGSGLAVNLSIGDLLRYAGGSPGEFQSLYKLGAVQAQQTLSIAANSSGQDRVDLISAHEVLNASGSASRNIISLPARTVTPSMVNTASIPGLSFTVTAGTPGSNPAIPATPGGDVPLWAVYVPNGATSIADADLIDLRRPMAPRGLGADAHGRVRGLELVASGADVRVLSGLMNINGAVAPFPSPRTLAGSDVVSGGFVASTEYALYAVARGGGDPVGKLEPHGVVFVAVPRGTSGANVNGDGRPSATLAYRPAPATRPSWTVSTTNALFIGPIRTGASGNPEAGNLGVGLCPDWSTFDGIVDPATGGVAGAPNCFLQKPRLSYVDANTVNLTSYVALLAGVPAAGAGGNATFAGNLAAGETRTNSTWYYVYVRHVIAPVFSTAFNKGATRQTQIVISSEAPNSAGGKPTPEGGGFVSSDYCFVGSFFNVTGFIQGFVRTGERVLFINGLPTSFHLNPGPFSGTDYTNLNGGSATVMTAPLPATSKVAIALCAFNIVGVTGNLTRHVYVYQGQTLNATLAISFITSASGVVDNLNGSLLDIAVSASNQFAMHTEADGVAEAGVFAAVYLAGYVEA